MISICKTEYLKLKHTMNHATEQLDYCRIKKIFDKGFGFLSSLHYKENVFFHFSKIKDSEKREKLEKLKRGVVSVFYTSKSSKGKRKVDKVWLDISEVPNIYFPQFILRLIEELNEGNTNPFEIIDALKQINEIGKLEVAHLEQIISSAKIIKNPSILEKLVPEGKSDLLGNFTELIKEKSDQGFLDITKNKIISILKN